MKKNYEVGYGKPPKHTRFQPGQSGNPKGPETGSQNFSTDVKKMLKAPVRITLDGKKKTVSTQHAALMRLREQALAGNARALDRFIELGRQYNDDELSAAAAKLSPTDAEIMAAYNRRLLRSADTAPPAARDDASDGGTPSKGTAQNGSDAPDTDDTDDDDAWLN